MKTSILFSALAALVVSGSAFAQTPAEAGFAKLASLAGKWSTVDDDWKGDEVTFTVVSDGSAVMEETMEMLTIYTQDNGTLLVTHYCDAHNQPRMRAQVASTDVTSLDFAFVDVSNAGPNDHFINHLNIQFVDANHIVENWGYGNATSSVGTTQFKLVRE